MAPQQPDALSRRALVPPRPLEPTTISQRGPIEKAEHTLNPKYKGAELFVIRAPDAFGTLWIWARDEDEAREHLVNACFDLICNRMRVGAHVDNPPYVHCGGRTQSGGRNSSGTRVWVCQEDGCRRKGVINRTFRGGINHPSQSKKPAFARLLLEGVPVRHRGICVHRMSAEGRARLDAARRRLRSAEVAA